MKLVVNLQGNGIKHSYKFNLHEGERLSIAGYNNKHQLELLDITPSLFVYRGSVEATQCTHQMRNLSIDVKYDEFGIYKVEVNLKRYKLRKYINLYDASMFLNNGNLCMCLQDQMERDMEV